MAILSGQQALDWMQANPKKDYYTMGENNRKQELVKADKGFFGNLLNSFTSPFVNVARGSAAAANKLLGTGFDTNDYITEKERENFGEFALKNLAGVASNFVPVGKAATVAGAATRGAGAGFLGSLGQQDIGEFNVQDIATGTALGGVLSGGLKKLGSNVGKTPTTNIVNKTDDLADDVTKFDDFQDYLLEGSADIDPQGFARMQGNKIERLGKNMQFDTAGVKAVKNDPDFYSNTRKLRADMDNLLTRLGEKPNSKGLQKLKNSLTKAKNNFIKNSDYTGVNIDEFADDLVKNTQIEGFSKSLTKGDVAKEFKNLASSILDTKDDISKLSKFIAGEATLTPQQMDKLRQKIGANARKSAQKIQNGTARDADFIINSIDQSLKNTLSKNVPGYLRANTMLANMAERGADMTAAFNQGNNVSNLGQQNLLSQLTQTAKSRLVGPALEEIGSGFQGVRGMNLFKNIKAPQVPAVVSNAANTNIARKAASTGPGLLAGMNSKEFREDENLYEQNLPELSFEEWRQATRGDELEAQNMQMEKQQMVSQLVGSGMSLDDAMQYVESFMPTEKEAEKTNEEREKESLRSGLAELESLYGAGSEQTLGRGSTTGVSGLLSQLNQKGKKALDQDYNNRLQEYNQMRTVVLGMLNKARGAGTLNVGEAEILMRDMPNEFTNDKVAQSYFNNLRKVLDL